MTEKEIFRRTHIDQKGSLGLLALGDIGVRKWIEAKTGNSAPEFEKVDNTKKKKVLVIGWDAADWKIINPLVDAGLMPAFEKLINEGVIGNIATLNPPLSPMLWTSIATGKLADKHGILGFAEPDFNNHSVRPVSILSRKTQAIWNILNSQGKKCNVISWWPGHPAEPIDGVIVSDLFYHLPKEKNEEGSSTIRWGIIKDSVHPESMLNAINNLRIHPTELTFAHLLPFVPRAAEIDQDKDKNLHIIAENIAEASTTHAVATHLIQYTEWDFTAVYFKAIDHFSHGFMKYHPPQLNGVPDLEFDLYKDVVKSAYIYHDMMLERLLNLIDENTTVILLSDHGFHSDHLRPNFIPELPAGPALEHNPFGVFVIKGPGIKKDERIYGVTLTDITPTILSIFDLPVGKDMDGKVLGAVFKEEKQPLSIKSWDLVKGNFGNIEKKESLDVNTSKEALDQLVELGYIESPESDMDVAINKTIDEMNYNLSQVFMQRNDLDKALNIVEKLFEKNPKDIRFNLDLFNIHTRMNEYEKADLILKNLKTIENKVIPNLKILEAVNFLNTGKPQKALNLLNEVRLEGGKSPFLLFELGRTYLNLLKYNKAKEVFKEILEINPDSAEAFHGLAIAELRLGNYENAVDHALSSTGLMYYYPAAHYHLGEALYYLQLFHESLQAFRVCTTLDPGFSKAQDWIKKISKEQNIRIIKPKLGKVNIVTRKNPEKAEIKPELNIQADNPVYIVSGLPRSGTSLMMQILEAGGIEILTDHKRLADKSNPKGYYEYEPVKSLFKDNKWLPDAKGKAVKIVAQLLQYLPPGIHYKVIFMKRDLIEVIQSQQVMLDKGKDAFNYNLLKKFEEEIKNVKIWAKKEPLVEMIEIDYNILINNGLNEITKLSDFISLLKNNENIIKIIDKDLYRNRKK